MSSSKDFLPEVSDNLPLIGDACRHTDIAHDMYLEVFYPAPPPEKLKRATNAEYTASFPVADIAYDMYLEVFYTAPSPEKLKRATNAE